MQGNTSDRKILYWVDPMHPSYKSDKPGIAPDCGMKLEPVYADGSSDGEAAETASLVPGTVKISSDRQQLIGVKVGTVEKKSIAQTIRLLGRIAVDETRVYFINATVDGWISKTYPNATGSIVKNGEALAAFYSPDFLSAQSAYIFALSSIDRISEKDINTPGREAQLNQFKINLQQYRDSLRNLGMGMQQIDEIGRSRQYQENVDIVSPADGIILSAMFHKVSASRRERSSTVSRI
jgi:hypothetical protein